MTPTVGSELFSVGIAVILLGNITLLLRSIAKRWRA